MIKTIAVFHGSPRKANTHIAAKIFLEELSKHGVVCKEFFLPEALPEFCAGCQLCFGNPPGKCPHWRHVEPILDAVTDADALLFTTPHHGVHSMSACMKNLLDHLDFLNFTVTPRSEMFRQKAFIITTGAGSASAAKPIVKGLKNWGVNRVYSLGLRMFAEKWDKMPTAKQMKFDKKLRRSADRFYKVPIGRPYISTIFMFHMCKFVIKKYVGKGSYPYEYWKENGFFDKRPF